MSKKSKKKKKQKKEKETNKLSFSSSKVRSLLTESSLTSLTKSVNQG